MKSEGKSLDETLRQGFKYFNPIMLLFWRLGLGTWMSFWPEGFGRYMVITHTGRKTGMRRQTPVNYAIVDGEVYCTAGFGHISDWYRNIMKNPQVEIWLPDGWWETTAEEVTDPQARLPLMRQVIRDSGFAGRLAGIDAGRISDEELDRLTSGYRLIHLRRTAPRTGFGGPGELAWVWPLATFLLLPLALKRRKC
jgi:deazaflavin-dependent oxidoreductase (nitroreductase family)